MLQRHYLFQQKVLGRWRYVSTVGLNETTIEKYIQQQEKHDIMQDKLGTRTSLRGRWGSKSTGLEQSEGQHDSGAVRQHALKGNSKPPAMRRVD